MTAPVTCTIEGINLSLRALARLQSSIRDMAPVMRAIRVELLSQTEANFAAEGRPRWKPLARSTIEARVGAVARGSKSGTLKNGRISKGAANTASGMKILQVTGQLAASVHGESGNDYAMIGSNLRYAAIHQLGGEAGRGRKTTIPARPYLPIQSDGELQSETATSILDIVVHYIEQAAR